MSLDKSMPFVFFDSLVGPKVRESEYKWSLERLQRRETVSGTEEDPETE